MRRRRSNLDLPRNLYCERKGGKWYFRYRHPKTGTFHGLGTQKTAAVDAALRLNQEIGATKPAAGQLIRRVLTGSKTLGDALSRYLALASERGLAANTLRSQKSLCKGISEKLGNILIQDVETKHVAEVINDAYDAGNQRKAQAIRSTLKDVFRDAIAEGWIDKNPAEVTRKVTATIKRDRLTLEQFMEILKSAGELDPWVSNAMLLALLTGQRVSDIARMRFKDVEDGWLHVVQKKTGNRVRLSLGLRLDVVGLSLSEVIRRCRDQVLSPHLIHHTKSRTMSKPGACVHENTVSKGFRRARELTTIAWKGEPATFNEIRSLAGRLYQQQGVNAQALLGHKDSATTAIYLDARNAEWITVAAS